MHRHLALFICTFLFCLGARGEIHVVNDGESIQASVRVAKAGDTIRVMPGTYEETVYIDKDDITLSGVIVNGEWPQLQGNNELADGVLFSGSGVTVENLRISNYRANGIMIQGGRNYAVRHNVIEHDTREMVYGIFPQFAKNGVVERNIVSGASDAAIYITMTENTDALYNEVFDSVFGVEFENSDQILFEGNNVHDNVAGLLTARFPGLPVKTNGRYVIRNNFIHNNNEPNPYDSGLFEAIPQGTGIVLWAADDVEFEGNVIYNNDSAGLFVVTHDLWVEMGFVSPDPEIDAYPDNNKVFHNMFWANGNSPSGYMIDLYEKHGAEKGADILVGEDGRGNCIFDASAVSSVNMKEWQTCDSDASTSDVLTVQLAEPVSGSPLSELPVEEQGRFVYQVICSGCHATETSMIGPPLNVVQALWADDVEGMAEWIKNPTRRREDYPPMPPIDYLTDEVRLAVARFIIEELPERTRRRREAAAAETSSGL